MTQSSRHCAPGKRILFVGTYDLPGMRLAQDARSRNELFVCSQANRSADVIDAITRLHPHILVLTVGKARRAVIDLVARAKKTDPRLKCLAISSEADPKSADRFLRAGADGYIPITESVEEIMLAIHDILNGGIHVSEKVLASPAKRPRRDPKDGRGARQSDRARATGFWPHSGGTEAAPHAPLKLSVK